MKKSIFGIMNFLLPERNVFPMHCSANIGADGVTALFFGLSGTGKTTLSADPSRRLIGDDEHGWSATGVFNFEGGCYAKCIRLSAENEPQIYNALHFGSVLENVVLDPITRIPDYDDDSKTENTRAAYPVEYIDNAVIPGFGGHPKNVVFLTADAFGVLPPVSKLTPEQAMYHFMSGYTAKVAGTEAGVTEPQATFSTCFGAPFMPLPPKVYAEMLGRRLREHNAQCWLVNTGWQGGAYGIGKRMSLPYTRAMVNALVEGKLANVEFEIEPAFGLSIPKSCPGVPPELLTPRNSWKDKAAYDKMAADLSARFAKNFEQFDAPPEVKEAGPEAYVREMIAAEFSVWFAWARLVAGPRQQSVNAQLIGRPNKYFAVRNGGDSKFRGRTGVIASQSLVGVVQLASQVPGVVGVQNCGAGLWRVVGVGLHRPHDSILVAIRGNAHGVAGHGVDSLRLRGRGMGQHSIAQAESPYRIFERTDSRSKIDVAIPIGGRTHLLAEPGDFLHHLRIAIAIRPVATEASRLRR